MVRKVIFRKTHFGRKRTEIAQEYKVEKKIFWKKKLGNYFGNIFWKNKIMNLFLVCFIVYYPPIFGTRLLHSLDDIASLKPHKNVLVPFSTFKVFKLVYFFFLFWISWLEFFFKKILKLLFPKLNYLHLFFLNFFQYIYFLIPVRVIMKFEGATW